MCSTAGCRRILARVSTTSTAGNMAVSHLIFLLRHLSHAWAMRLWALLPTRMTFIGRIPGIFTRASVPGQRKSQRHRRRRWHVDKAVGEGQWKRPCDAIDRQRRDVRAYKNGTLEKAEKGIYWGMTMERRCPLAFIHNGAWPGPSY